MAILLGKIVTSSYVNNTMFPNNKYQKVYIREVIFM